MRNRLLPLSLAALLAACGSGSDPDAGKTATDPVTVRIVAFNDLHGHIDPIGAEVPIPTADGEEKAFVGGAATLASAIAGIRAENPDTLVISAGDLFGSSHLTSALFLDEPTVTVMNRMGLDFNAVGNHEFDSGLAELKRMQDGGCEKHTALEPCALEAFEGAKFQFLAANVLQDGKTIFPASAMRTFGTGANAVQVGIIGLTLKGTPFATKGDVEALTFADEADTINAETRRLRQQGADAIVVALHSGLTPFSTAPYDSCGGIAGPLREVLDRLEPGVDLVLSGHTHEAYICDYSTVDPERPMLITSAMRTGFMFTDITLTVNAGLGRVTDRTARNIVLQRKARDARGLPVEHNPAFALYDSDDDIAAYVQRYSQMAKRVAAEVAATTRE